jgi:DedD protein
MDSRAKQRLTGAVILVAVLVLFVPELLTGPHRTDTPATPADEGLRRYTIDLDAQANSGQPKVENEPAVALPPVAENPLQPAPALAVPGEAAQPEPAAPAPNRPVTAPAEADNVAPVTASTPARVTPTPATAPPVETSHPTTPVVQKGSFAVQLGSFGSRDNAERLVRDMTAKGFAAFVAPITSSGRELFRVRVGPTRDRAQAEALAAQLRRIGQTGSIVPIS